MLSMYGPALLSAIAWAISAPVVTSGLKSIPSEGKARGILLGLLASLTSGTLCLLLFNISRLNEARLSFPLVAAGVFTFPIATGLYYLCGHAFNGQMEIASQFARVKPLFSLAFAVLLLGEPLTPATGLSLLFVATGVGLFIYGSVRGAFRISALVLGIATALSWAIGEIFIKRGIGATTAIVDTFVSLYSATLIFAAVTVPMLAGRRPAPNVQWIIPFVVHGAISFGIGYASYYESIRRIGVGRTALVTAFWPVLALGFAYGRSRILGERFSLPRIIWIAAAFLLLGSVVQTLELLAE